MEGHSGSAAGPQGSSLTMESLEDSHCSRPRSERSRLVGSEQGRRRTQGHRVTHVDAAKVFLEPLQQLHPNRSVDGCPQSSGAGRRFGVKARGGSDPGPKRLSGSLTSPPPSFQATRILRASPPRGEACFQSQLQKPLRGAFRPVCRRGRPAPAWRRTAIREGPLTPPPDHGEGAPGRENTPLQLVAKQISIVYTR